MVISADMHFRTIYRFLWMSIMAYLWIYARNRVNFQPFLLKLAKNGQILRNLTLFFSITNLKTCTSWELWTTWNLHFLHKGTFPGVFKKWCRNFENFDFLTPFWGSKISIFGPKILIFKIAKISLHLQICIVVS